MPRGVRNVQTPGASAEPQTPETEQAHEPAAVEPEPASKGLRAADVDPTKIKRAVLTLDGWVCPATSPAPPAKQ